MACSAYRPYFYAPTRCMCGDFKSQHTSKAIDNGLRYGNSSSCATGSCDIANPYPVEAVCPPIEISVSNVVSFEYKPDEVSSALGDGFTGFGGGDAGGGGSSSDW